MQTRIGASTIPSFNPLSTLIAWRIFSGIRGEVTTTFPRAASVGERMKAIRQSTQMPAEGKRGTASNVPVSMVSGSPMNKSRKGMPFSRSNLFRLMVEASTKRINTRVSSAITLRNGARIPPFRKSTGKKLAASPTATNTIGAVIIEAADFRERSPYPKIRRAVKRKMG